MNGKLMPLIRKEIDRVRDVENCDLKRLREVEIFRTEPRPGLSDLEK